MPDDCASIRWSYMDSAVGVLNLSGSSAAVLLLLEHAPVADLEARAAVLFLQAVARVGSDCDVLGQSCMAVTSHTTRKSR